LMKPCHPKTKRKGKTRNKMEGPMSKKTNEPPKRANHKRTSSSRTPLQLQLREAYQIKKGEDLLQARRPNLDKPSPTATACLKVETSRLHLIL
jgi:hypothetical protein